MENGIKSIIDNAIGRKIEQWTCGKLLHRIDGPAYIIYDNKGRIIRYSWIIYGKRIDDYEVGIFLSDMNITWPIEDEEIQTLFLMKFYK